MIEDHTIVWFCWNLEVDDQDEGELLPCFCLHQTPRMQCNPVYNFINFEPVNCYEFEEWISSHHL
uniref:Lipid binding protein n=1 Tax=Rhizophora mucronata TaxID=61149 RepID=A0A2P2Q664_RHIMU